MIKKRDTVAVFFPAYACFRHTVGILAVLMVLCRPVWPQPEALPEDPPKAFFTTMLGDDEVDILVQGLWEASILSAGSYSFGKSGAAFNATPFLFRQLPDLYLLLTFRDAWWFEASVADDIERSSFALGYTGGADSVVKEARLGNSGIAMPDYPYLAFGSPKGAFGVSFRAQTERVSFDAMARWDGLSWRAKSFFGLGQTVDQEVYPVANQRGLRFALPHAGVEDLRLFDLSAGSTRQLAPDEYAASLGKGTILLNAKPRGKLYAYYVASGLELGGTTPHTDSPVAGLNVLLLFDPAGDWTLNHDENPYEARNTYALAQASSSEELFVHSKASGKVDLRYEVRRISKSLVEVVLAGSLTEPLGQDDGFMRPFLVDAPWVYDNPPPSGTKSQYPAESGFTIVSRRVETLDSLAIEPGAVDGTVTLTRDGIPSDAFEHDQASGSITLYPAPRAGESIEIRYAMPSQDRSDGGIVFGAGTRFPWLGLDWSLALGGRWSLPGEAFAEGGELKPAWAGISASSSYDSETISARADAFLRYSRASASGLYRLAGMEDEYGAISPFRLTSQAAGDFSLASAVESDLAAAYPRELGATHAAGQDNRALRVEALTGASDASAEFIRYVEPVPLSSFKEFSFFVRKTGVSASQTSMSISIDDGSAGKGLSISGIELDGLDDWVKITLNLEPAKSSVLFVRQDGQELPAPGASGTYDPSLSVSRIAIRLSGMDGSEVVWLDELALAHAQEGVALLGSVGFSLGDERNLLARSTFSSFMSAETRTFATFGSDPSIAGSLRAGVGLGGLAIKGSVSPSYSEGLLGLGCGYGLYLTAPGAPFSFSDEFSRDAGLLRYARSISLSAAANALGLAFKASAASQEESLRFSQNWNAELGLSAWLSLKASAGLKLAESLLNTEDIGSSWLRSWELFLPAREADARVRTISLESSILDKSMSASLLREFIVSGREPALEATSRQSSQRIAAALSVPFELGFLKVKPNYERSTSRQAASSSPGFHDDAIELGGFIAEALPLWASMPFYELFSSGIPSAWPFFASGSASASHSSAIALALSRPIGFGLVDLWLPSSVALSYRRLYESALDVLQNRSVLATEIRGGAANLFGKNGARPLFDLVAFDEYSSLLDLKFSIYADGASFPNITTRQAVSFEGEGSWDFSLSHKLYWEKTRTLTRWSDGFSISISQKPEDTWFRKLVFCLIPHQAVSRPDEYGPEDSSARPDGAAGDKESYSVARWLSDVFSRIPILRDTWNAAASVSCTDSDLAPLVIRAELSYETRIIQAGILSIGFKAALNQSVSLAARSSSASVYGGGYEISLDAKLTF